MFNNGDLYDQSLDLIAETSRKQKQLDIAKKTIRRNALDVVEIKGLKEENTSTSETPAFLDETKCNEVIDEVNVSVSTSPKTKTRGKRSSKRQNSNIITPTNIISEPEIVQTKTPKDVIGVETESKAVTKAKTRKSTEKQDKLKSIVDTDNSFDIDKALFNKLESISSEPKNTDLHKTPNGVLDAANTADAAISSSSKSKRSTKINKDVIVVTETNVVSKSKTRKDNEEHKTLKGVVDTVSSADIVSSESSNFEFDNDTTYLVDIDRVISNELESKTPSTQVDNGLLSENHVSAHEASDK
jgi:hypothetical protein